MKFVRNIVIISFCLVLVGRASAALNVTPGGTATQLWSCLFPEPLPAGVTINSITYTGYALASGCYSNMPAINGIQPNDGLIMTSGQALLAIGPNSLSNCGFDNVAFGDAALNTLAGGTTNDAAVLTVSFTIDTSVHGISFDFVFGSDEYKEYLFSNYNDVFGAFLDGTNISLDSTGNFISVNNNFFKIDNLSNQIDLQMDGFTPLLRSSALLTAGTHTLKLAIADVGDHVYDSEVFLSNFQFSCSDTGTHPVSEVIILKPSVDTNFVGTIDTLTANVQNILGVPVVGRKVVFEIVNGPHAGMKDSSITNVLGDAIFTYTGVLIGQDEIVARMIDSYGVTISSNLTYHVWKEINTNTPPTTNPVSISNPNSAVPTIGWTYLDVNGNPQTQYEVEVWTGANGTGSNLWNPAVGSGIISSVMYAGSPLVNGQMYYARVRAHDGTSWGAWSEESWVATLDLLPVAEAGPDRNVRASTSCNATVTLDGTGSSDPDGGAIVTYTWNGPGGPWTGATPVVTLPVGTSKITLTILDNEGSSATDSVFVSVIDSLAPVPKVDTLPVIHGSCSITLTPPTANDNCAGTIIATTTDPLTYNSQDTFEISWTYNDGNGNTSTQTQTVIIDDTIAPVPSKDTLPELRSDCALTVTTIPTATDNCSGIVTATTTDSLTFTAQGNDTITWTYEDDQGNKSTQQQAVIIKDLTPPIPLLPALPELYGMCSVNLTRPQANDNCKGTIVGVTTSPMVVDQQGDHEILWTFDDGNGNRSTQVQLVIVKDSIAPRITIAPDTALIISASKQSCVVSIDSAKAFDSCSIASVSALRSDGLPLDTAFFTGTTVITWKACDANGNCDSVAQSITVKRNRAPVLTIPADTSMREGELINYTVFASDTDGTVPRVSLVNPPAFLEMVIDNGVITIISRPGCTDHGLYAIAVKASDGVDSVISQFNIRVDDIDFPPVFSSTGLPQIKEQELFNLQVRVSDCDGTVPRIRIVNTPIGASFVDNRDGHGTFTWTPAGDDNGYYVVVFEAADGNTTVRDTVVIEVVDVNCFSPVLNVSSTAITTSVNLPVTILATASDGDGIPPQLKISALPSGARFTTDEALGTGVFTWTPKDTGTYPIVLTAVDAFDPSVDTNCTVMITVNNNNITGPVFLHRNDTTIEQNKEMILRIEAQDPDGSIPELYLMSGPLGARLVDNKNGTGNIIWNPACDIYGNHPVTVGARDQSLSDSLKINIHVRDVNCAPVINHIPDVSAKPGEIIQMSISAYDPDNDGSTPILSVACDIPGFTFVISENADAEFRCIAPNGIGLFPVVFYANDGITTDSMKVIISIGKYGTVKISGNQNGTQIFSFPSGCFSGTFLGQDSITFTASQGIYWFEVQAPGYRAQRFSCNIKTDSLITQTVTLKPSIPLMFSAPDTLTIENTGTIPESGSFSFVDLNGDGIEDLVITSVNKCMFYTGIDSIYNNRYRSQPTGFGNITAGINTLHHVFADWKNNKNYDCILSDRSGNIVAVRQKGVIDTLVVNHSASLYPLVLDVNNDGIKDLLVHSEGLGLFVYRNIGTDSLPVLNNPEECKNSTGQSLTDFKGAPVLLDLDNDSKEELIILSAGVLKVFTIDSSFSMVTYKENLNGAGTRISADSLSMSLIGSSRGTPKLAIRTKDKILIYQTHLLGDVNYDSIINIKDISRISKQFEYTDTDSGYNPVHNLKLSETGNEVIDVRDISRASRFWEMQE